MKIRPPALRQGDRVGVIAPSGCVDEQELLAGCDTLRRLGFEPVHAPSILDRDLYFAGSVERRLRELHDMFARPDVRAVLSARGGYGCHYLLPRLDLDLIRRHPKIFMGYSDVTSLLTWLCDAANLVVFHGPMVAKDFARHLGGSLDSLTQVIGAACDATLDGAPLVAGSAEGILYGGCLSLLVASLGTPYEINTGGTLLFIEDVNAAPYQIDRMLMQLKLAGKLSGVRGIAFGEMLNCHPPDDAGYTLRDVIVRVVGELGVPVGFGFPSGHVQGVSHTVPFGIPARLECGPTARLSWGPAVSER